MKTGDEVKIPKRVLQKWIKGRKSWNHEEWLALLDDLRNKGYDAIVDTQAGKDAIGAFLEANRAS